MKNDNNEMAEVCAMKEDERMQRKVVQEAEKMSKVTRKKPKRAREIGIPRSEEYLSPRYPHPYQDT